MQKSNIFKSLLISLLLSVLTSLVLAIATKITHLWAMGSIVSSIVMIFLIGKHYYEDLKIMAKNFKEDMKKAGINILLTTVLLTALVYIANYIIVKIMGGLSVNEIMTRGQIKSSPFMMSMGIVIFSPILEEMIYRLPYLKIEKHKIATFIFYSFIFAIMHIAFNNGIKELIYFIPYMLLSLDIGYGFYKTNNIFVSMLVHILYNLSNVMILLFI